MVAHGLRETPGRGYRAEDAPIVLTIGVGAMLATAFLVMVIYLIADAFPESFYQTFGVSLGIPNRHFSLARTNLASLSSR